MSSRAVPGNHSDDLRQMFASAIKKNTCSRNGSIHHSYLLGPTMSFALHLTGKKTNLRHIKTKSCIIILIDNIHAVTYVLHCILLAKKILLNQQLWKTSIQLNKLVIPHFPEPTLCHVILRLGFLNQMRTAGCLACYSTASPSSSITTSI